MIAQAAFPEQHQQAMQDPADAIHRACDFLILSSDNRSGNLIAENQRLHSSQVSAPWPDFLVAFASQGCGDYFAYDMRQSPPSIIYIDPDSTPEENLAAPEALRYSSFEEWYESQLEGHTCQRCGNREVRFSASEDKRWLLRICSNCGFEEPTDAIDP